MIEFVIQRPILDLRIERLVHAIAHILVVKEESVVFEVFSAAAKRGVCGEASLPALDDRGVPELRELRLVFETLEEEVVRSGLRHLADVCRNA